jgi:hypothetical protein
MSAVYCRSSSELSKYACMPTIELSKTSKDISSLNVRGIGLLHEGENSSFGSHFEICRNHLHRSNGLYSSGSTH